MTVNIFHKLFEVWSTSTPQTFTEAVNAPQKTSGELITEVADGNNLVDGKPTWFYANEKKNDLSYMLRCCEAEVAIMQVMNLLAAPYYFERTAILLRKSKDYQREIEICESYIAMAERFYQNNDPNKYADVRKGPRFQAIVHRISKARQLLLKVSP